MTYGAINLLDNNTVAGTFPDTPETPLRFSGDYIIGFYGDFSAATVSFQFYTETPAGALVALPVSADWTFTEAPGPERFTFSRYLPFRLIVTGTAAGVGVNLHGLPDVTKNPGVR